MSTKYKIPFRSIKHKKHMYFVFCIVCSMKDEARQKGCNFGYLQNPNPNPKNSKGKGGSVNLNVN